MRNDRPKNHWKIDWHARLTHQIGSRIDWHARLTRPSRWISLIILARLARWQADGLHAGWRRASDTKKSYLQLFLIAEVIHPCLKWYRRTSTQNFIPQKTPIPSCPVFFPTFFEWIQIGVSHKKTATCPYRCNLPYLLHSRPLKVFMQDQNQKVKLNKYDDYKRWGLYILREAST